MLEDGDSFTIPGVHPVIRVGDKITMRAPVKRPWWAFWRPRFTYPLQAFRVTRTVSSDDA